MLIRGPKSGRCSRNVENPGAFWMYSTSHVRAHRTKKKKKAMTEEQTVVMEGRERAKDLAREVTDDDGGQIAAAEVQAIKQLRT